MAKVDLILPKMGESITEATILKWVKQVGDPVEIDETIVEIATDKVDSEVPSPVEGVIEEILFGEDDVVPVGKKIAIISTESEVELTSGGPSGDTEETTVVKQASSSVGGRTAETLIKSGESSGFYSPLVRNIAQKENISAAELAQINGTGLNGRVTKKDILAYIENRSRAKEAQPATPQLETINKTKSTPSFSTAPSSSTVMETTNGQVEIIEMDRMRRLIADHMVHSKHTSPHVTSFVEVDVTNIVNWRNKIKKDFQQQYGEKITFTPIFVEACVRAIKDFPMVNISVKDNKILVKKSINIGMATALPNGNLIVPVIKNADEKSLVGLTKAVNDLASRARENQLKPADIQDGTFTLTNVGTFGNVMGTPIINQPQVAILAAGAIRKKPAVVETEYGDLIAVRQMMFLSLSYDHRVVDGYLGGSFLRRIGDYLEQFDPNRSVY